MLRIIATLSFFTRLPFWRLANVPKEYYERVVPLWPIAGWVTGGCMALTYMACSQFFSVITSIIIAFIVRVLITGALHEDGFADFCDGFGGGTSRERTLEIMKDSHIGTYGVLGLILYFILMISLLSSIPLQLPAIEFPLEGEMFGDMSALFESNSKYMLPCLMFIADVMSKAVSSTIVHSLPYARKEEEAKNKLVYANVTWEDKIITLCTSLIPCALLAAYVMPNQIDSLCWALITVMIARCMLVSFMKRRIQGYTGDCCGAMFIICECVFYATFVAL